MDDDVQAVLSHPTGLAVLRLKTDQVKEVLETTSKEHLLHMTVHLETPSLGEVLRPQAAKVETALDRLFGSFVKKT